MPQGRLLVFEGLDRAGKTSQCEILAQRLRDEGLEVVELKFPDRSTSIGKMINEYLVNSNVSLNDEAIHLLFSANRWEVAPKIKALLAQGATMIIDRYVYSGAAFSAAKGLDLEWCKAPDSGLPVPDMVVFLDVDESVAMQRGGFGDERYEKVDFQRKVRSQFQQLKTESWAWISANASMGAVSESIYEAYRSRFPGS